MKIRNKILLTILTAIVIFVFTKPFLLLYEAIAGRKLYEGSWVLSGRMYVTSFVSSYVFFTTLVLTIFGGAKKKTYIFLFLFPFMLLSLGADLGIFMKNAIILIVALILGELVLKARNLIKRNEK